MFLCGFSQSQEVRIIENTDPALLHAYEQLKQIETQIAERERQRAEIAAKARWLGEQLPNSESRTWANLAFDNLRQLSAVLGRSQRQLSDQVDQVGEKAADLKSQVAKRERKLAAAQQAVAQLRTEVQAYQAQLEHEPEEIRAWAEELLRYGTSDLDPSADNALLDFSKRMQAKRVALEWFAQTIVPAPRG